MADIDTDAVEKSDAVRREEEVLQFWKDNDIPEKARARGNEKNTFVFYEGPPTANGRPGVHHMESRSFKDAIPRYKTMRGFRVPRRAGWDTHGLPVELEVEKQLGFSGKQDIEKYGIAEFNRKCRESVFSYINEWERFSERIGYWADQKTAYFTFNAPFMESLFAIFKKVSDDGRVYKDYRVVPWCTKCGTALSSHELAQGYEDVKDLSITAKFELVDHPGTYFLAWTTTPWTLPGNVALAVGPDIDYVKVKVGEETYILAKERVQSVFGDQPVEVLDTLKGSEFVGEAYKPLYPFAKELAPESERTKFDTTAYKVYPADFVTTEDGSGIVHTAVMYGQDDFELGQKLGLPKMHLVQPDGTFIPGTGFLEGASVIDPETNVAVLKDLQEKGLFFSKENYLHAYPHCWRSKNRLIYYARDSWYIRMTELRDELIAENQKVNWEPAHIRDGRMGEWLANVRDWAVSRERYWGTPLPVWQSEDGTEQLVIGSVEELRNRTKKSGNTYFVMRHGGARSNEEGTANGQPDESNGLTDKGRAQVLETAKELASKRIEYIYTSPLPRAVQTAHLVAETLGLTPDRIKEDVRLIENNFGGMEGGLIKDYEAHYAQPSNKLTETPEGAEAWGAVKTRMTSVLYGAETSHAGAGVLLISHEGPIQMLEAGTRAYSPEETAAAINDKRFCLATGHARTLDFIPLPHNENYELDLHRPYIDDVVLISDSGTELRRVKEVMDVWFDSGAMPFGQDHYPFENKEWIDTKGYPADFISEAIDQTRGWFYTLLAVGVLMGKGHAYKNVICLGHLLDEKGQKMSKSKGNIIEPMAAVERYGADTIRFWMYSVNQPGDSKNFDDKTVKEAARVISWFENSVKFYQLFAGTEGKGKEQVIDTWMRTRVSETIDKATKALDVYDLYTATRTIATLVEDLSQWYVRRVRDRVRDGDEAALTTLRDTLEAIAVLLAPFTPFVAEWAYQVVRSDDDAESVHLADWYEPGTIDVDLIKNMETVRTLASEALRARQVAGIKVRQPLAALSIPGELPKDFLELLMDEVNVEEVIMNAEKLSLETSLSPELVRKGDVREFARALADARKEKGLEPRDMVHLTVGKEGEALLAGVELPGVSSFTFANATEYTVETSLGPIHFSISLDAS